MTTIKEHIDTGHYPKDDKGRALVPVRGGIGNWTATIIATDAPGHLSIVGFGVASTVKWNELGKPDHPDCGALQPPPCAVSVEITRYMIPHPVFGEYYYSTIGAATAAAGALSLPEDSIIVLSGRRRA